MEDEKDRVNLYAIVLDCSAPYFMEKTSKYQCTLKLIDTTINPGEKKGTNYITATVFAKTEAEIPQATKVGSIIRMHRAQTKKFKTRIQVNCDVNIKGAWILFDPADGVTPINESGSNYTFNPEDKNILKDLRKFGKEFFANHDLSGITLEEALEKKPKDFDTLCLILDIKKKGAVDHVKLCDAGKVVKLDIPKKRCLTVAPGEVVRIRSANYVDEKTDILELNEYSNILRIPAEYKAAKELMKAVNAGKASDKVKSKLVLHTPHLNAPMTGSKITESHKQTKAVALKDLFAGSIAKSGQKFFKIHVGVTEVGPKNPKDWICVTDKKSKKQYFYYRSHRRFTLDEVFKGKKGKLPAGMEFYYKMQLFVQDKSVKNDTSMYIVFLCTLEGRGADFIKLDLGHEYPTEKTLGELKRIYKTLTNPFVTLDMMVESVEVASKQPVFFAVDTTLTI